jgi:hypothetical protein
MPAAMPLNYRCPAREAAGTLGLARWLRRSRKPLLSATNSEHESAGLRYLAVAGYRPADNDGNCVTAITDKPIDLLAHPSPLMGRSNVGLRR